MSLSDAVAHLLAYFGAGTGLILMDEVFCTGTETRLVSCTHTTQHNCVHSEDASVTCNSIGIIFTYSTLLNDNDVVSMQ